MSALAPVEAAVLLLQARALAGEGAGHAFHGNQWAPNAADDVKPNFDFASQAVQFPELGKPGLTYSQEDLDASHKVNVLLHRDDKGIANGVLYHYRDGFPGFEKKGNVNVMVDPSAQRQGIATKLWDEADRRWKINLKQQTYTAEGRKFITNRLKLRTAGGPGSGNFGHQGRPGEKGGSAGNDIDVARSFQDEHSLEVSARTTNDSLLARGFKREHFHTTTLKNGWEIHYRYQHPNGNAVHMVQRTVVIGDHTDHTLTVHYSSASLADRRNVDLKMAGGAGSGNFGHSGRPGELGGSSSDEEDPFGGPDTLRFYHGTASQALASIKQKGLIPVGGKGADAWAISVGRPPIGSLSGLPQAIINDRKASVFLTEDPEVAKWFGDYAKQVAGGDSVVLEVEIPQSEIFKSSHRPTGKMKPDEMSDSYSMAWRFRGVIKPEWIKGRVILGDYQDEPQVVALATRNTLKIYVVVLIKGEPKVAAFNPDQERDAHGQWTSGGGKSTSTPEERQAEEDNQTRLAAAQTNPLAHPPFVLGMDNDIHGETMRYVAAYGQEFKAAAQPSDLEYGKMGECYRNASMAVMSDPNLTYVEGFATSSLGLTYMHAWAVDKDNNVIDPTWKDSQKTSYFGVKYDRDSYLKYLYKAKIYGVTASTFKNAQRAIETGGKGLR